MSPPEAGQGTRKLEDRYKGYDILDSSDDKIDSAGGVFVDDHDGREYIEVQGGLVERALGTGYYLLPVELCTVDDERDTSGLPSTGIRLRTLRTWTVP